MEFALTRALVRTILHHADDYPWRMQDIGLLGLWLDEHREFRLHVWNPTGGQLRDDPQIHDHPFDFSSLVIAGEMTNTRYEIDPAGSEFVRYRYGPPDEEGRLGDTVGLSRTTTVTYAEGGRYEQLAHELHDNRQLPGTVSIIRCAFRETRRLTVCRRSGEWVSGQARSPSSAEVKKFTTTALGWF